MNKQNSEKFNLFDSSSFLSLHISLSTPSISSIFLTLFIYLPFLYSMHSLPFVFSLPIISENSSHSYGSPFTFPKSLSTGRKGRSQERTVLDRGLKREKKITGVTENKREREMRKKSMRHTQRKARCIYS